jgi:Nucleoside 2-deoxyribosyltransferase/pfkB family carbohydrate kinase
MIVAGGVYYERCFSPNSECLFGSGGRAAAALSDLVEIELHTFFPSNFALDVYANMASFGVKAIAHPSSNVVNFFYHFPLSPPRIAPLPFPTAESVKIVGEKVLRFGCIEGEMIVNAEMAVFDPQSGGNPQLFQQNGSKAARLAMVLNSGELSVLTKDYGSQIDRKVAALLDTPEVLVVKCGPYGALVYENGVKVGQVPIYRSKRVFKIGSGDIFSAMFAYAWMELGMNPLDAADFSSRYVAHYVETRAPVMPSAVPQLAAWTPNHSPKKVYLAGSFFSTEHLWLVEEVFLALKSLNVPCFSPMHHVGISTSKEVAAQDLKGMDDCALVLALLSDNDPGTLFEIGYAISLGKKVLVLSENPGPQDLTMIIGTDCIVFDDLATIIYEAAWAAME